MILKIKHKLLSLSRKSKRIFMVVFDIVAIPASLWIALVVRTGDIEPYTEHLKFVLPITLVTTLIVFAYMGVYKAVLRFVGTEFVWMMIKGISISALALGVSIYLLKLNGFPRSVPFIYWMLAILFVGGGRFLAQAFFQSSGKSRKKSAIIYGAGVAGHKLSVMLANNPNLKPICFVDDNEALSGSFINGLRVYPANDIKNVIEQFDIEQVLLAIPSATQERRRIILSDLESLPVHIFTVPGVDDIVSGRLNVEDIREIDIADLLGREQVPANQQLLHACIQNKVVLVSGAGGSIGSELCRQIILLKPKILVLYEISEFSLYSIDQELESLRVHGELDIKIIPVLGDIKDKKHLLDVLKIFGVQTIYHAAAYKHVPMVEGNIVEGVKNNIFGTNIIINAAVESGVETFVLISTDKAVRPTNVMGATKRFAELILQDIAIKQNHTRVCMVRFGNVLGSSGSVVPVFRKQIEKGGPVTVTHPEIIRYFMTIPEAAELVIQAGSMGKGGDVFVLDMGEPVKIVDLARRMIHLSGYKVKDGKEPGGEIEIKFTGLRPGEKLYEELLIGENVSGTEHKMIMRANEESLPSYLINENLDKLEKAISTNDVHSIKDIFLNTISGYRPDDKIVDALARQDELYNS